ncbi:MAG: calcium/sodium antiporter, partial [Rhodospirillales bacterium]|nr:calcium/sodium antiporter [Rhodospirillales bacterium]
MTFLALCMVVGGLLLLLFGGEILLRGAVSLARCLGLSSLLIGMTVVAAATSMPEMVVAVASGLRGAPDIGVGNVIGSNIANILLILGVAALLYPMETRPHNVLRDGLAMIASTALFIVFAVSGTLDRVDATLMLALLIAYLAYSYRRDRKLNNKAEAAPAPEGIRLCASMPVSLLFVVGGVGVLVVGSKLLVDGAVDLARAAGVSEAVIGLTLVAVGTSLPELATAVVASFRRHPEVALGNVLGSNLFNIMAIIPALALTTPFTVTPELLDFDVWFMAGVTVVAFAAMVTGWRIGRGEAAAFLVAYALYIGLLFKN